MPFAASARHGVAAQQNGVAELANALLEQRVQGLMIGAINAHQPAFELGKGQRPQERRSIVGRDAPDHAVGSRARGAALDGQWIHVRLGAIQIADVATDVRDEQRGADVVPGSRGRTTCADAVLRLVDRNAAQYRFSVAHDEPYRGGFSTTHYGRPRAHVHAIQIELARRLYMDEQTLVKKPREFQNLKAFCRTVTEALGGLSLAPSS